MPDNEPRPEAIAAASCWGDHLRELAATRHASASAQVLSTLTPENIAAFEATLAAATHAEMEASNPHSVSVTSQFDPGTLADRLENALKAAGIEAYLGPQRPIFPSMSTTAEPGLVVLRAFGGQYSRIKVRQSVH